MTESNFIKLDLPPKMASLIETVLVETDLARDNGYLGFSSQWISEITGRMDTGGQISACLWMMADSGYLHAYSIVIDGYRQNVWLWCEVDTLHPENILIP